MTLLYSLTLLGLSLWLTGPAGSPEEPNPQTVPLLNKGVVVELALPDFEAAKTGIRPGDILLSWSTSSKAGDIESPFHLNYLRLEEASRVPIKLRGRRGSESHTWLLGSNYWGMVVRPHFKQNLLSVYQEENELAKTGHLTQAIVRLREIPLSTDDRSSPWLRAWFIYQLAESAGTHQSYEGYDNAYQEALRQAAEADPVVRAELLKGWANGFRNRGDLNRAEELYTEAIGVYQTLGLRTMAVSNALKDLGSFYYRQGNLDRTQECFLESLSISKELAPAGIQAVWGRTWLGAVSQQRGEFAAAEEYYKAALVIEKEAFPHSPEIVVTLQNLGTLAHRRGDLAKAEIYYRTGLVVAEKLGTDTPYLPNIVSSLAECVLDRGHLEIAERYETRALVIREKQQSDEAVASSLRNLGKIARIRGELDKAGEYYQRALAIAEKTTPPLPAITRFLVGLGYVARDRRDPQKAEEYFRRALAIMDKISPSGLDHAETLADLAGALRDQNQLDAAAQFYQQALGELEDKTSRLGGVDEDRSRYRAQHDRYRKEYVDVLVAQGQPGIAFQVLEASRARTLLEVLARGNINVRGRVNASLLERQNSLKQLRNVRSADRLRLLSAEHTEKQLTVLDQQIADLLLQYQDLEAEIRTTSPAYAALTQPHALTVEETQQLLDGNTMLLEYSLGEPRSYVWAVSRDSLVVYQLPKRAEIETVARQVYESLTVRDFRQGDKNVGEAKIESRVGRADNGYQKASMKLSLMVLGPVAPLLKDKRLLIVSDGALQYIPFSALPIPGFLASGKSTGRISEGHPGDFIATETFVPLIMEHEIVNLPSVSVLAELRREGMGRPEPPNAVAVLADPVFSATDERVAFSTPGDQSGTPPTSQPLLRIKEAFADHLSRSIADVSATKKERFHLNRLIYTRREAEAIISMVPASKSMKAIDFKANRRTATSAELGQYQIVHFATHGLLNNEHPELSGLVLSLVNNRGQPEDGFLELEDIYNMHLPVNLVVLSACDTALGQEMNGEGIIGLTRGFMYAGATRIVASLWRVNDAATSDLMERFYKEMRYGKMRPAAALRAAQVQMWRQKRWNSPFYWAAFQIHGDWK